MASLEHVLFGAPLSDLFSLKGQAGFGQAVFYSLIADYLDNEIVTAFNRVLGRTLQWVTGFAALLMSLWVWWQGWRIMTGQSQESMARFFAASAQRVFIIGVAFMASIGGTDVFDWLANELPREINFVMTGENESPSEGIDENLAYMQLALSSIDVLQTGGDPAVEDAKTRSAWLAAIGTAGPAVIGGAMLLINKIAMGLFIGFGPLFVLMLVFDYTKPLFQKWLYYGIGTIFALVMLNLMISIATEMITRVAGALWLGNFVSSLMGTGDTEGVTSRALQQGGVGMILSMLIVSTPPMAAAFFNGVMGQFSGFNMFQSGSVPAGARGPGSPPGVQQTVYERLGQSGVADGSSNRGGSADPRNYGISGPAAGGATERAAVQVAGERGIAINHPSPENLRPPTAAHSPSASSTTVVPTSPSTPIQQGPARGGRTTA